MWLDPRHSISLLEECGDDSPTDLLWHLDRIDQIGADLDGRFARAHSGWGSVVYVMDTGIRADHVEFEGVAGTRVIAGIEASSALTIGTSRCDSASKALAPCYSTLEELSSSSHGTAVASVIAGRNTGVAPAASLVSVRIMNERGLTTTASYMQALEGIVRHAWDESTPWFATAVVNISGWVLERLDSTSSSEEPVVKFSAVERKIRDMINGVDAEGRPDRNGKRFLFVVAANNIDGRCDAFPATLGTEIDGVVTVGGMTLENFWWRGSCRGGVEVLAPAQGIFSATITAPDHYRGRRPNQRSGTSFAAPVIAGIAAQLLEKHPGLTPQQLEATITNTPSRIENAEKAPGEGRVAYIKPTSAPESAAGHLQRPAGIR